MAEFSTSQYFFRWFSLKLQRLFRSACEEYDEYQLFRSAEREGWTDVGNAFPLCSGARRMCGSTIILLSGARRMHRNSSKIKKIYYFIKLKNFIPISGLKA